MAQHDPRSQPADPALIAEQAAAWLARRDRGLTAAEQDDYVQWLAADPKHAEAMTQHAAAFERMMKLYEWQPGQSAEPNADLFVPRRRWSWPLSGAILAAAAALALCATFWWRDAVAPEPGLAQKSYLRVNERHALPDGSIVELKDGSRMTFDFSAERRQVRLSGEGHFIVAKDAARPFVVEAGGVAVRAVGTEFNVRVEADAVEVLVTEGRVRVRPPSAKPALEAAAEVLRDEGAPLVTAKQRVRVGLTAAAIPQVSDVSPTDIAEALAWQAARLQFFDTPLTAAVAEFNQRNRVQLILGDAELQHLRIGGTFRVNNVEGFVRLLEVTLDLRSEVRGANEIVLRRAP